MPDLTPDEFRALGHLFVDAVADARAGIGERPVRDTVEPGTVRARFAREAAEEPSSLAGFPALVDAVTGDADTRWQHPGFHAFFPANASLTSLLGDLLSGAAGVQGMLWSTSPACTEVEQAVTDQLARALGLPETFTHDGGGGGSIQDSASSAALVALTAALHRAAPDPDTGWRARGVTGRERVYVSPDTHSSLAKAVRVAGLGAAALRTVPCSPGTRSMDPAALRAALRADVEQDCVPVLVCATVGTTSTGASDPVGAIVEVAAEHGAWVHVDAAWAGVAALCPEHRWVIDGVDRADSFCTDAHKWLLTAFDASLLWVRDAAALPSALSITPPYLRDAASDSGAVIDFRDWQIPLGRRFRALKLWAVLHGQGLSGLREHLRGHVALAGELAERIRGHDGLELACEPVLSLVCLWSTEGDAATRALLERVNADGRVLLSATELDGRPVVRVAFGSIGTTRRHLDELWEILIARS
ncbi:pyridoxal phosphate-dependent decarboxylase family protein [Pseudonocardia parietis]|uniref:Aromatic-L-amino-acid decarboxylase n=1 Tax=Pseudonocardia parietis TaxID=570936 RepID=A0ABS4VY20_9PSEU|nr:pyridoxal-dependent decarboxylase [Pseudonocardia parietis]MBP2368840.1 aromatic-L-amino-acid decarboxylase [Pseudonocardia parietis]